MADDTEVVEGDRDVRVGQVLDEFLRRREAGECVTEPELLAEHPDLADDLRLHLKLLCDLTPAGDQIAALISRGILRRCDDPGYVAALGAYRIVSFVGRGGMGVVLKAYDASLDRFVALKVLRPELGGNPAVVERFRREARAAAALRHPNIVTIHAVGEEAGVHYIAMEYVPGPSLGEVIRKRRSDAATQRRRPDCGTPFRPVDTCGTGFQPVDNCGGDSQTPTASVHAEPRTLNPEPALTTATIREIFRQLLTGLAAAHEAGLIHRDVKSANILLDTGIEGSRDRGIEGTGGEGSKGARERGSKETSSLRRHVASSLSVKLADFGLARMADGQTTVTADGSILGTPEYMSPEQARGEKVDHRTDLYSAGVVLYEMLTGRTPFKADTPSAVIHQILNVEPRDPRKIDGNADPVLASLALRLMAKRPEDRLASASKVIAALEANGRVRLLANRRRWRRRLALSLCGFAVLVGAAWGASWLVRLDDAQAGGTHVGVLRKPSIVDVKIEKGNQRRVLVQRDYDGPWDLLYEAPPEAFKVSAQPAILPNGDAIAVVGLYKAVVDGCSLFGLDAEGVELWNTDLAPVPAVEWPDCNRPERWVCETLTQIDLNQNPGDEIVVARRSDGLYPAGVSIVDPQDGKIKATFWHLGHIRGILIVPDFFPGGRPAILVWGTNNKLDCFERAPRDGERQLAHWDQVPIVMILDPDNMNGIGPPLVEELAHLQGANPFAYAFLDLPDRTTLAVEWPAGSSGPRKTADPGRLPEECGVIERVKLDQSLGSDESGPRFLIDVVTSVKDGGTVSRAGLVVDRDLIFRHLKERADNGDSRLVNDKDPEHWEQHWRPIIQNHEYIQD